MAQMKSFRRSFDPAISVRTNTEVTCLYDSCEEIDVPWIEMEKKKEEQIDLLIL